MSIGTHEIAGTSLIQIIYDYMCKKTVRKVEQNYKKHCGGKLMRLIIKLCCCIWWGISFNLVFAESTTLKNFDSEWKYTVVPYAWVPGISTGLSVPASNTPGADISAADILSHLSGAAMFAVQANLDEWGIFGDFAYAKFSNQRAILRDRIDLGSTATVSLRSMSGAVTYQAIKEDRLHLDVLVGARNIETTATLQVNAQVAALNGQFSNTINTTDPILGFKGRIPIIDDKWFVPFYFDLGGKGGHTNTTWQAFTGVGKNYEWGDVILGYRALFYDMKSGNPLQNTTLGGFTLGVGFHF